MEVYACDNSKGLYAGFQDVNGDSAGTYFIDKSWKVGTKYSLKVEIANSVLKLYYNDILNFTVSSTNIARNTLYFKSGNYCHC
jgi:hypothetical protein